MFSILHNKQYFCNFEFYFSQFSSKQYFLCVMSSVEYPVTTIQSIEAEVQY